MATKSELVALLRECRDQLEAMDDGLRPFGPSLDMMDRIDAALAEPEAGKTVRVSVPVYVNSRGDWSVNRELLHRPVADYFITADVPLPQAVEVEGEAE